MFTLYPFWVLSQYKDGLYRYWIPIIKIKRHWNSLIFIMGFLYWQAGICKTVFEIQTFTSKKMHFKMSSGKCPFLSRPRCVKGWMSYGPSQFYAMLLRNHGLNPTLVCPWCPRWYIYAAVNWVITDLDNDLAPMRRHYFNLRFDGLVQERCNSSALAMELRLSCINPSFFPTKMHLKYILQNIDHFVPGSMC